MKFYEISYVLGFVFGAVVLSIVSYIYWKTRDPTKISKIFIVSGIFLMTLSVFSYFKVFGLEFVKKETIKIVEAKERNLTVLKNKIVALEKVKTPSSHSTNKSYNIEPIANVRLLYRSRPELVGKISSELQTNGFKVFQVPTNFSELSIGRFFLSKKKIYVKYLDGCKPKAEKIGNILKKTLGVQVKQEPYKRSSKTQKEIEIWVL